MDIWITIIWCVCVRADKVANDITTKQLPAHSEDKRERERETFLHNRWASYNHNNGTYKLWGCCPAKEKEASYILSTRREGGRLKIYAGSCLIIFWCIYGHIYRRGLSVCLCNSAVTIIYLGNIISLHQRIVHLNGLKWFLLCFFSSLLTQRLTKKSNLIDFRVSPYHPFDIFPPPPSYPPISPWKCVESGSRFLCFLSVAISHHSVQQRLFFFCCYIKQQFRSIADELDFFNSPILLLLGGRWTLFEKISIKSYGRYSFLLQRQIWIYVYEWMSSLW